MADLGILRTIQADTLLYSRSARRGCYGPSGESSHTTGGFSPEFLHTGRLVHGLQSHQGALKLARSIIIGLCLILVAAPLASVRGAEEAGWGEEIAPGIEFRLFQLPDPNNVFVARMERSNLNLTLESSIAQGRLSGGTETVANMAQRYDEAINFWGETWGKRNQVVVAINGFYFGPDMEPPGVPWSGQVHSGWYAKRFWENQSGSGFAWNLDRSAFIGECVYHPKDKQTVTYFHNGLVVGNQEFDGINIPRGTNQFILYTPQYDANTLTDSSNAVEVLVRLPRPALIVPYAQMTRGTIVKIRSNGSTAIPFDHVVLSMQGMKKDEFLSLGLVEGDEVGISQKIKDCTSAPTQNWDKTYASIGGAFYFLKNGEIQDFSGDRQANVRDPRTAIAYNNDYIYFIVVDGRDTWHSVGMTIPQLAQFTRDVLGATYGIAQDGGGSSTMVVNGEVVNNTYCNIVICKGRVYLPIIERKGRRAQDAGSSQKGGIPSPSGGGTVELSGDGLPLTEEYYAPAQGTGGSQLQRLVANGMMMVVVQPMEKSSIFSTSQRIRTQVSANVRLGPGTNYAVLETVPAETPGIIYEFDNGLNGVFAKGYYWWRVLLEIGERDVVGWVAEPYLAPAGLE